MTPDLDIRSWAAQADEHAGPLLEAAAVLGASFDAGSVEAGLAAAAVLAERTGPALAWIGEHPCPSRTARAELSAALRVHRNAAFAYRRAVADPGPETAIAGACAGMLEQGRDHAARYRAKVETDPG